MKRTARQRRKDRQMRFCSCFNYAGENVHCVVHGIEPAPEGVVQVRRPPAPETR